MKSQGWVYRESSIPGTPDKRNDGPLDARAVPPATGRDAGRGSVAVDPVDADDGGDEPEDGAEEGEGDVGLPLGAGVVAVEGDAAPVKDIAAATIQPL